MRNLRFWRYLNLIRRELEIEMPRLSWRDSLNNIDFVTLTLDQYFWFKEFNFKMA